MINWVELTQSLVSSPWLYLVLAAVSLLDSFLPLIPSEPVVIIAGVFAATGQANLALVIAATALGAFLGDQIPYALGRWLSDQVLRRLPPGTKRRATHDWMARQLQARGGFVLLSTRFIPVGRYLATATTGIVRYSYPHYVFFTMLSGVAWSAYTVLSGYLGGVFFRDNTLVAVAVGIGLALLLSGLLEANRHLRSRRTQRTTDIPAEAAAEDAPATAPNAAPKP